ncbi:hypothetical protein BT93_F3339 [Corymbia citriodora subsp. variegata]|nr:hypothetical protein BT93_F3339 [Corymbia citriodora subsp. variegata]
MSFCADDPQYLNCSSTIQCGDLQGISYPFWGLNRARYCGLSPEFQITCNKSAPIITIMDQNFQVLRINNSSRVLTVARSAYWYNLCPRYLHNTSQVAPFTYTSDTVTDNLTLYYGCPSNSSIIPKSLMESSHFTCTTNQSSIFGCVLVRKAGDLTSANLTSIEDYFGACNTSVIIPVNQSAIQEIEANATLDALKAAINQGFGMQWPGDGGLCQKCLESGGQCGQVQNSGEFTCYCRERSHSSSCPALPAVLIVSVTIIVLICFIRKTKLFKGERNENQYDVDELMRNHGSLVPRRYKYTDVKKMTNSLAENVGQGGYGEVYKGKLKDGRPVAVKFLKESKGNGEEFINEVTSISRTAHVNIVALLGFCYEKNRRALIYEYMPNGSLDKYLPSHGTSSTTSPLEWKILYRVALGVARGLEYLHQGCSTRILHFDIKPQNILLDQDFIPKISDFGLAKLCKGRESVVSMLGTRGTFGYIAPEVISRNFGGVSHKSDVYSYGMLVLKMVGGRNNSNARLSNGSLMYFPELEYRHLESGKDLQLGEIITAEEEEIARKMIIVSIWCIQTNPSDRPSISKVIEMLEGSLELLPIPPKPIDFTSIAATF